MFWLSYKYTSTQKKILVAMRTNLEVPTRKKERQKRKKMVCRFRISF